MIDNLERTFTAKDSTRSRSQPRSGRMLALLVLVVPAGLALDDSHAETAATLIEQARRYDNMYTLGPEASQEKALRLYESALKAEPNDPQRLHILYRMAQLYGSAYQLEKGEKPDFRKAIELCREIIGTCPPDEPLVYKAMLAIGDHYVSLWEFEHALAGFKKLLERDVRDLEARVASLEQEGRTREAETLRRVIEEIIRYQEVAVDQVVYSANFLDPLRAQGELRNIADRYAGTSIGDKASNRLQEEMDKFARLWMPDMSHKPDAGAQLRAGGAPAAGTNHGPDGGVSVPHGIAAPPAEHPFIDLDSTGKKRDPTYVTRARAPPFRSVPVSLLAAACLMTFGLAVAAIKARKRHMKG